MDTTGFLAVDGMTIVDNHATAQVAQADPASRWQVLQEGCVECACPTHSCWSTITDAPWYDPTNPASVEFFGLFGTLTVTQPSGTSLVAGTGTTVTAAPKQLTFVGLLAARTARGATYGRNWVANTLDPLCKPCDTRTATIGLWCPDSICGELPDTTNTVPDPVDWSTVTGIDGCADPDLLPAPSPPPEPPDNGLRVLHGVTYNPGSFAQIPDAGAPLPTCHGLRVTFSLTVTGPEAMAGCDTVCVMEAPTAGQPEPCCTPLRFNIGTADDDCGCPTPCDCVRADVSPQVEGSPSPRVRDTAGINDCRYSTPLCSKTFACLVDTIPWQSAAPIVRVTAGSTPLRNVSIRWWQATQGLPSPATPSGFEMHEGRQLAGEPVLIADVPAQATVVVDSVTATEEVHCPGLDPAQARVESCGGRRYRHHRLTCGHRYWVAVEIDCANPSDDWRVEVDIAGLERV